MSANRADASRTITPAAAVLGGCLEPVFGHQRIAETGAATDTEPYWLFTNWRLLETWLLLRRGRLAACSHEASSGRRRGARGRIPRCVSATLRDRLVRRPLLPLISVGPS